MVDIDRKPMPGTAATAARAAALPGQTPATPPTQVQAPVQAPGIRSSRALPYALAVEASAEPAGIDLRFVNTGASAAVLHVYDRLHPDRTPRRFTVAADASLSGIWLGDRHDLWVLGPNGFHRHLTGDTTPTMLAVSTATDASAGAIALTVTNPGPMSRRVTVSPMAYDAVLTARERRWGRGNRRSCGGSWRRPREGTTWRCVSGTIRPSCTSWPAELRPAARRLPIRQWAARR